MLNFRQYDTQDCGPACIQIVAYDNQIIEHEKYDASKTYKKNTGYFPGVATKHSRTNRCFFSLADLREYGRDGYQGKRIKNIYGSNILVKFNGIMRQILADKSWTYPF